MTTCPLSKYHAVMAHHIASNESSLPATRLLSAAVANPHPSSSSTPKMEYLMAQRAGELEVVLRLTLLAPSIPGVSFILRPTVRQCGWPTLFRYTASVPCTNI